MVKKFEWQGGGGEAVAEGAHKVASPTGSRRVANTDESGLLRGIDCRLSRLNQEQPVYGQLWASSADIRYRIELSDV